MRIIGLDIGSFSIKVAEFSTSGKNYTLRDFFEFPLSADLTQDTYIQKLDILRKIASHYDPAQTRFVIAVSQQHISVRNKSFPFRERHKINRTLGFELEDDVPFAQDTAIFESKICGFRGATSDVLAMAVPNAFINELISLCSDAGIDPEIISSEGIAISSLVENWQDAPPELEKSFDTTTAGNVAEQTQTSTIVGNFDDSAQLLLQIGHKNTILVAYQNARPLMIRHLDFGGYHITQAISKKYNLSFAESQKILQERGFVLTDHNNVSQDQIVFSQVITDSLHDFISQVKLTILEIACEHSVRFTNVWLAGGVSKLMNLAPYITQKTEVSTNLFRHFHNYPQNVVATNDNNELTSTTACGLCIEGTRKPKNPAVNFRKEQFAVQNAGFSIFWQTWKHAIAITACALLAFYVHSYLRDDFALTTADKSNEAVKKQAKAIGLKPTESSPAKVRNYIKDEKKNIQAQKDIAKLMDINSALDILKRLSERAPQKEQITLDVRRFYVLNEVLTIEGLVGQPTEVSKIRETMRSISADQKVDELAPTIQPVPNRVSFAYAIKMQRHSAGAVR